MTARAPQEFLDAYNAALTAWDAARSTERLWAKDASLWTNHGEERWLGWLDAPTIDAAALAALENRIHAAMLRGTRDVLLIGMGGSSLGPEVIARVLPRAPSGATVRVLDSTEPSFVHNALAETDWRQTMVVVASKSGSTLEPDILLATALDAARATLGNDAPKHVIAITDPGSHLFSQATQLGFAATFAGDPSIGGRYSVLSPFGLVPAAMHGVELSVFMRSAHDMAAQCHGAAKRNPGVQLGVFLATAAKAGRDKCTLVRSPSFAALGPWIEQLIAESTGKNGKAILPIDGEPLGKPSSYGNDRAFVYVRDNSTTDALMSQVGALAAAGCPTFTVEVPSTAALAGEFFRWEFATAVAASIIGVNAFDQPDVEASKIATRALTDAAERGTAPPPVAADTESLRELLASINPGDYVALLAFLPMFPECVAALQRTRLRIRDARGVATSVGFGPRFLHSTGQAFKGGPNTGVFIQLTCDAPNDLAIPGRRVTFGTVVAAQAAGDLAVLRDRGRRVAHVHVRGDLTRALADFDAAVAAALA